MPQATSSPDARPNESSNASSEASRTQNIEAFCLELLEAGDLDSKLRPPPAFTSAAPHPTPAPPEAPKRSPELAMTGGAAPLPRPGALRDPALRALCLARFAHHELQAVELFAWALLRWPELPETLRRGWLGALADEQRHCRMYLDRLTAHGASLGDFAPHSDYFWRQQPAIEASPHGPLAFLAALGLTLEQANLDFALTYRDAFREAGDEASASVCQRVHDDEVGHVRLAHRWLCELSDEPDCVTAYEAAVPFPLSAARAKGKRFDEAGRREAGLDEALIARVRSARSAQETRTVPADATQRSEKSSR